MSENSVGGLLQWLPRFPAPMVLALAGCTTVLVVAMAAVVLLRSLLVGLASCAVWGSFARLRSNGVLRPHARIVLDVRVVLALGARSRAVCRVGLSRIG